MPATSGWACLSDPSANEVTASAALIAKTTRYAATRRADTARGYPGRRDRAVGSVLSPARPDRPSAWRAHPLGGGRHLRDRRGNGDRAAALLPPPLGIGLQTVRRVS